LKPQRKDPYFTFFIAAKLIIKKRTWQRIKELGNIFMEMDLPQKRSLEVFGQLRPIVSAKP
jgi:hypothetical protein